VESAAAEQYLMMLAHYDAVHPTALKRLVGGGAQLRTFPRAVLDACHKATQEVLGDFAAKSAEFKKIYEPWQRFRDDQNLWFRVAEHTLDTYRFNVK
jgi:TRAP-type mannitol/chloroaromatic compound transport system substrate-binding protein